MRPIDADKMQEWAFQFNFEGRITERELYLFNRAIEEMPMVDAVPVRHGHWIDASGMILCSECGDSWGTETEEMVRSFNYCPNCGAKMDVEEQDETN